MTFVTGLVLAAGGSKRLGQPKQLLPFGESGTLLDHVLSVARRCAFDQALCVIGGGGPEVRGAVDLDGFAVVDNPAFGEGCSSSIAAALTAVDPLADVLVLMLGDQPGVTPETVAALLAGRARAELESGAAPELAACAYEDGRGHPFAFGRAVFGELATLHGDKGVWKLLDRAGDGVVDVPIPGLVPLDVDTWEDYGAVLAARTGWPVEPSRTGEPVKPSRTGEPVEPSRTARAGQAIRRPGEPVEPSDALASTIKQRLMSS